MTPITFASGGYRLAGNLFAPLQSNGHAVLFIQGWTGHQNLHAAEALAGLGFTCLTYDMRGNRTSEGDITQFSRADYVHDAVAAYDYLREQIGKDARIGVVGSSFGSYTGVLLTAERDVAWLSLRVPATYPDQGFNEPQAAQSEAPELQAWRLKPVGPEQNRAFALLHAFAGPIQIIEAGADEQVPHRAVQNYVEAVANPNQLTYHVMKDAPHSLVNEQLRDESTKLLVEWVQQRT